MNLNPIKVGDLPLASYVSYTQDISAYIGNVLNDVTYRAPNDMLNTSVSAILSSMSKTIIDILRAFGGSVVPLDDSGQPTQTIYVVKFQYDNGSLISEQQIVAGQSAVAPAVEERSGYRFTGWSVDFTNIQQDIIVVAEYAQIPQYTVTFYDYDMHVLKQDTVEEGQDATPPENPERTGYQFTSWNGSYQNVAADSSVSASYNPRPYIVSFDSHGGSDVDSIPVTYDGPYGQLPSTSYDGYSFDNWYLSDDFSESSKVLSSTIVATPCNHTLRAHWIELQKYAVKFIDWNGNELSNEIVIEHQDAIPPSPLPRTGYEFAEWRPSFENITGNTIISAMYKASTYKVTLHADGGTIQDGISSFDATYDSTYGQMPSAQYDSNAYAFTGWYNENNEEILSNTTVSIADDHDLYAHWREKQQYQARWMNPAGDVASSLMLYENDVIPDVDLSTAEVPGYEVTNWSVHDEHITSSIDISADWQYSKYTVTFNANLSNSAYDEMSSADVYYMSPYSELPVVSCDNYDFAGWFTLSTGGEEILSDTIVTVTCDHVLHAHWTHHDDSNMHTVRFIDRNGNELASIQVESGCSIDDNDVPTPPSVTGYRFNRWSDPMSSITADTDISAQYTANQYTVTFESGTDGRIVDPHTGSILGDNFGVSYQITVMYDQPYGEMPSCMFDDGSKFDYWKIKGKLSAILSDTIVKTSNNHRLVPCKLSVYNVAFIDWDGRIISEQEVRKNGNAVEPEHPDTQTGYSFSHWSQIFTNVTSDINVSAQYEPNTYEVSFDPNGGTMDVDNDYKLSVVYGQQYGQLPNAIHSNNDYEFCGWHIENDEIISSTALSIASNHILCAWWIDVQAAVRHVQEMPLSIDENSLSNLNEIEQQYDYDEDEQGFILNADDWILSSNITSVEHYQSIDVEAVSSEMENEALSCENEDFDIISYFMSADNSN